MRESPWRTINKALYFRADAAAFFDHLRRFAVEVRLIAYGQSLQESGR